MKIRHKRTGVVLEGEFREFDNDLFIEVGKTSSTYSSSHWEPVQEWVDVTSECRFGTYSGLAEKGLEGWGYITAGNKGSVMHPDHWNKVLKIELIDGGIRVYARKGLAT